MRLQAQQVSEFGGAYLGAYMEKLGNGGGVSKETGELFLGLLRERGG